MKAKLKVVFGTNIYISAIIFGGNPRQCLELARSQEIELFTSKAILLELVDKLRVKFSWGEEDIYNVIEGIIQFSTVLNPKKVISIIENDPLDKRSLKASHSNEFSSSAYNRILECDIEAKVGYIVSGDKRHLLSLKKFKNIPIISAKQFLDNFFV